MPKGVPSGLRPQIEILRIDSDAVAFLRGSGKRPCLHSHAHHAGERQTEKKLSLP
jgi:hypothetical protein